MRKSLVALAILSAMSVPALAQSNTATVAQNSAQPNQPQTVKKRICEVREDDNPYSRLGSRKVCRTVEVPVQTTNGQPVQVSPAPADPKGS